MKNFKIILASQSQGRKKLLSLFKIPFEVISSTLDEEKIVGRTPLETIQLRARRKGEEVSSKLTTYHSQSTTCLALSADSGAILGHELIGKPKDRGDAERILRMLSGTTHEFVTAIYATRLQSSNDTMTQLKTWETYEKSLVTFRKLTDDDIRRYLSMTDFTKYAGGYALFACPQCLSPTLDNLLSKKPYYELLKELSTDNCMHGRRASPQDFIIKIEGSLSNVIGLPLEKVLPILKENNLL